MTKRQDRLRELQETLGVPLDPEQLNLALTHRSYAYEQGGLPHNERLEFLGDAVLGMVVTDKLYRTYPDLPEGQLAKLRAAVVNARALAEVGRALGIGDYLLLGRGEETTGGRDKLSIVADVMEAIIGAVYISSGLDVAGELVHRLFDPLISASAELGAGLDWKTSLQEAAANAGLGLPAYVIVDSGLDHEKEFDAQVLIGGEPLGTGYGRSKKVAEQQAAEQAYRTLLERAATD
ncbi:MAG: ribonuclease III [Actinobacteria bacterium]|uniref:ribonuclease III n=1 Tax=freshwater metagenome TaxID=449393 RepID=A0A6J7D9B1_9ZZZZ|nr:ribonuclease III [Actinomycetota bacterium]